MRHAQTAKYPFFDIEIFQNRTILLGCIVAMLGYTALFTNSVLLPFYLTDIMHLDPVKIGLLIMPFPVTLALTSAVSGALNAKWQELGIGEIRLVRAFKFHGKIYCFYKDGTAVSAIIAPPICCSLGGLSRLRCRCTSRTSSL